MDYLGRNAWLQTYSFEPTSSPWQANIFDIFVNWNKAFWLFKIWNGIKIRLNVRCGRNLKAHSKFKFKSGSTTASFLLIFVLFKHKSYRKNWDFGGIQTRIVGGEGKHADHLTTTTAQQFCHAENSRNRN